MDVGLDPKDTVSPSSTYMSFMDLIDSCFGGRMRKAGIHVYGVDYGDEGDVERLLKMIDDVEGGTTIVGKVGGGEGHWYGGERGDERGTNRRMIEIESDDCCR